MSKKLLVNGEVMHASVKKMLNIEEFLLENYLFRQNVLNGKVEYVMKQADGTMGEYGPLTKKSLNSIILRAKENADEEMGNPQADIKMYVDSDEVPKFDPIAEYLNSLPKWDGHNHVADLFCRIPGISTEQLSFLAIWIRSVVAHWLQMDTLHGLLAVVDTSASRFPQGSLLTTQATSTMSSCMPKCCTSCENWRLPTGLTMKR